MSHSAASDARIRFFASLREATGTDELLIAVADPISLDELFTRLADRLPATAMSALRAENVRLAVNQTLMNGPVTIQGGDEVAFLPPVTGG